MAQHRGHGQPRRPKGRRRAGAGTKRPTAAAAPTGTGMAGGPVVGQLYWANGGDGTIWQANLDGSNPQALVTGQHDPVGVAVDPTHLYWANHGDGSIWWANLDGSNPKAIVTGQDEPVGVAVDTSHLYWANQGDNSIWWADLDGSNPKAIVIGQEGPFGVAVDDQPSLLGQQRRSREPAWGRLDLVGQPGWRQPPGHRHRPAVPDRGGGRRQPPVLGQLR